MPARRTAAIVLASVVALLLAAIPIWATAGGIRQGLAYLTMTNAVTASERAGSEYAPALHALAATTRDAADLLESARSLAAAADTDLVDAPIRADLASAADALAALVDQVGEYTPAFEPIRVGGYTTSALEDATEAARERIGWYHEHQDGAIALGTRMEEQGVVVRSAAQAVFASAVALAGDFDADNWLATVDDRLAFRRSADALEEAALDADGVAALERYVSAAQALAVSHEAELESFAGALLQERLAVAEFANSIAGGVFLDFDWVPELFGYGSANGGLAGQASLEQSGEYYYSRMTLTDSVAERWGDGRAESIVAHEVGHAITLKCIDIFNAHADGDYEAFATAWAIGMGYDTPSNGQAAYGRPSDELIEATLDCR